MTLRYEVERGFLDKMHLYLQHQPLHDAVGIFIASKSMKD